MKKRITEGLGTALFFYTCYNIFYLLLSVSVLSLIGYFFREPLYTYLTYLSFLIILMGLCYGFRKNVTRNVIMYLILVLVLFIVVNAGSYLKDIGTDGCYTNVVSLFLTFPFFGMFFLMAWAREYWLYYPTVIGILLLEIIFLTLSAKKPKGMKILLLIAVICALGIILFYCAQMVFPDFGQFISNLGAAN